MAGTARMKYAPNVRLVRLMCSGRIDPDVCDRRRFAEGADGVMITGCHGRRSATTVEPERYKALRRFRLSCSRTLGQTWGSNPSPPEAGSGPAQPRAQRFSLRRDGAHRFTEVKALGRIPPEIRVAMESRPDARGCQPPEALGGGAMTAETRRPGRGRVRRSMRPPRPPPKPSPATSSPCTGARAVAAATSPCSTSTMKILEFDRAPSNVVFWPAAMDAKYSRPARPWRTAPSTLTSLQRRHPELNENAEDRARVLRAGSRRSWWRFGSCTTEGCIPGPGQLQRSLRRACSRRRTIPSSTAPATPTGCDQRPSVTVAGGRARRYPQFHVHATHAGPGGGRRLPRCPGCPPESDQHRRA